MRKRQDRDKTNNNVSLPLSPSVCECVYASNDRNRGSPRGNHKAKQRKTTLDKARKRKAGRKGREGKERKVEVQVEVKEGQGY